MDNTKLGAVIVASVVTYLVSFYLLSYTANTFFETATLWLISLKWWQLWIGLFIICLFPEQIFASAKIGGSRTIELGGTLLFAVREYFGSVLPMFSKKKTGIYGNAKFMSWWDKWRYWFNSDNHGWSIGNKSVPREDKVGKDTSYEGFIVIGPPGVGKSTAIAIMSIFRFIMKMGVRSKERGEVNLFCNDPAGELYAKTSAAAKKFGYKTFRLCTNSRDRNKSIRFNPMSWCKDYSDLGALAGKLIEMQEGGSTDSTSKHFMTSAKTILTAILTATWTQEPKYRNLPNAYRLLLHYGSDKKTVGKAIEQCLGNHETLRLQWTAMQNRPEKELGSSIASAENALAFTGDPTIAFILSGDDFDVDDLRNKKMIFYNQYDENDKHFKPVNALLLSYAFSRCMQEKTEDDTLYRSTMFILEECYTLGYVPGLSEFAGNCRKYKCGLMLIFQGLSQLESVYKREATAITDGIRSMAIFRGLNPKYYEEAEKTIGYRTDKDENGQERKVPLISIQEIEKMSRDTCVIKIAGEQPIKSKFKKYFQIPMYLELAEMGAVPSVVRDIEKIDYLDFSYDIEAGVKDGFAKENTATETALIEDVKHEVLDEEILDINQNIVNGYELGNNQDVGKQPDRNVS